MPRSRLGKEVVFRADAVFAKPEIYEALEERGVKYAIRLLANACDPLGHSDPRGDHHVGSPLVIRECAQDVESPTAITRL
jgi:hypothetical protein